MKHGFVFLLCLAIAHSVQKRGVVEEFGKLFGGLNSGFSSFQRTAQDEFSNLGHWAESLEQEMQPAFDKVEERLGSALDNLGMTFGRDRVDSHFMNTNGMPGLQSMLGQSLDPFSIFGLTRQNWYEGPNVCIDRKVINEDGEEEAPLDEEEDLNDGGQERSRRHGKFMRMDMSFTTCRDDHNYHECTTQMSRNGETKKVTVRHQCCYGFERSSDGSIGCTKMIMEDLATTIKNLGVEEFSELLTESGMELTDSKNLTIFVPSNDAIEDFRHDLERLNSVDNERNSYNIDDGLTYRKKRDITIVETPALDEILKAHMVEGFMDTADVHDEDILESVNGLDIRMTVYNTYPQRAVMANCAKVMSRDHYSTNGVVHIVDKVMMPATKSLKEMIETDVQFTSLKAVLEKANLMDKLAEPGQLTFLAPNNDAFSSLDADTLKKIERGNGCSKDILLHHLLPNVICTGVIDNKAKTMNVNDKYIIVERNDDDELFVDEDAAIVTRDIMGTNGVIHVIDKVLIPEAARTVEEVLQDAHMTTLEELFDIAGMNEAMDSMSNMTIFAPSEKALAALPRELLDELKEDPARLREFLMYHVTSPKTCHCDMENNKLVKTGVPNKSLRINTYGGLIPFVNKEPSTYTVQCAKITHMDDEVCGGTIHSIDKVLMPPIGNLIDLLQMDPKHSIFMELIKFAELETELNNHAHSALTILAPTDGAFDNMNDDTKEKIFGDKELAAKVVKHHILREMLCCSGITRNFLVFDQSTKITLLEDDVLNVRRSSGGYLYADRAELTTCDMVADNGVVHSIDRVLLPLGVEPRVPQERSMQQQNYGFNNPLENISLNPLNSWIRNMKVNFQ